MSAEDRRNKLEFAVARAGEADVELKYLAAAFETMRNALVKAWQDSDARDDKGREKLWLATAQLSQVERTLRTVAQSGQMAAKELAAIKAAGEPRKFFRRIV